MIMPSIIRPQAALSHRVAYLAPEHLLTEGKSDPHKQADISLAHEIGAKLAQHYPRIPWAVRVDGGQGVALIQIPAIMGATGHYVLMLSTIASDPSLACVMRAGGEILERYRMPTTRHVDEAAFHHAVDNMRIRSVKDAFPE